MKAMQESIAISLLAIVLIPFCLSPLLTIQSAAISRPPPAAIPCCGLSPSYTSHWYAGAVWASSNQVTSTKLTTEIKIPSELPPSGDFYYVLVSVFDNGGSYDQLGISADFGVWGLTYSYTSNACAGSPTYYYNPGAISLKPGITYTFKMTFISGTLSFEVFQGTNQVWSLSVKTGGTYFVLANSYCGYYNYTDYEEVYYTTYQPYPSDSSGAGFNFMFPVNKYYSSASFHSASWYAFLSGPAPTGVSTTISKQRVTVLNT